MAGVIISTHFDIDNHQRGGYIDICRYTATPEAEDSMHAHGLSALHSWLIAREPTPSEARRLRHLAALADGRAGQPSLLDRAIGRVARRRPAATPEPTLDCCAVA
jgi:hypothetical protein